MVTTQLFFLIVTIVAISSSNSNPKSTTNNTISTTRISTANATTIVKSATSAPSVSSRITVVKSATSTHIKASTTSVVKSTTSVVKTTTSRSLTTITAMFGAPSKPTDSAEVAVGNEDVSAEAVSAALGFWGAGMPVTSAIEAATAAGNTAAAVVLQVAERNGTSREDLENNRESEEDQDVDDEQSNL